MKLLELLDDCPKECRDALHVNVHLRRVRNGARTQHGGIALLLHRSTSYEPPELRDPLLFFGSSSFAVDTAQFASNISTQT
jgi:hypothetical protein